MSDARPDSEQSGDSGPGVSATVEELFTDLSALAGDEPDPETHEEVRDVKALIAEAHERGLIDSSVRDLHARDAAQAFVGSVIFASPLLVEDGVFDIATHLFEVTVAGVPVFLIANTVFVVFMTYALLEWTGRNREETHLLGGVIPVRLLMVLGVSFVVAAALMTVWGRAGGWHPPAEAIARINVIWTVGSLGAALGDILSEGEPVPILDDRSGTTGAGSPDRPSPAALSDSELIDSIHTEFAELAASVDSGVDRRTVHRIRNEAVGATLDDMFGDRIEKYTGRDIAEAFVGSIFFSIPFLVEDGVFDVADYFLSFRVGVFPVFFAVNTVFVLLMILALVYWAGPQDVRINRPILGVVPRRLVGIAVVSFLTAAALMTMWGRVEGWSDPVVAVTRISVVWTVASFGAALGDILPGESSGDDINDNLAALGEATEERADEGAREPQ
jgi:uncharacterized membrane protein